jgi:hypothetical protein
MTSNGQATSVQSREITVDRISPRTARIARLLLSSRRKETWPWLTDTPGRAGRRRANKFFAGCIVDYQTNADFVWDRVAERTEKDLGDPKYLWKRIVSVSPRKWQAQWRTRPWHKFPKGHERVRRIGKEIVEKYMGDVRNVWRDQGPTEVYARLMSIRVGPQLSRMVVGALIDAKEVRGKGDVKADIHVKRVLGRVLRGEDLSERGATEITREMHPKNPWLLDAPLYSLGKYICTKRSPKCSECYLRRDCVSYRERRAAA